MEHSEIQIIQDVLNGKSEKFRLLVDRYAPMVFMAVGGICNNEEKTEELAEKIFVEAYNKLGSYDGSSRFSSWLYSLAINYCRDYETTRAKTSPKSERQETSRSPDQKNTDKDQAKLLRDSLKRMAPEYSEAFLLRYYEKMSFEAMSKRLGVEVPVLKQRVHFARKELIKILK